MPEAKSEQLQQAPALLLATPLQGRDSYVLGEPTVRLLDSILFQGIWSTEVPQDCCPTPQCLVSWISWLLKPSLQKGLPSRTGEAMVLLLQVLGPGLLFLSICTVSGISCYIVGWGFLLWKPLWVGPSLQF